MVKTVQFSINQFNLENGRSSQFIFVKDISCLPNLYVWSPLLNVHLIWFVRHVASKVHNISFVTFIEPSYFQWINFHIFVPLKKKRKSLKLIDWLETFPKEKKTNWKTQRNEQKIIWTACVINNIPAFAIADANVEKARSRFDLTNSLTTLAKFKNINRLEVRLNIHSRLIFSHLFWE